MLAPKIVMWLFARAGSVSFSMHFQAFLATIKALDTSWRVETIQRPSWHLLSDQNSRSNTGKKKKKKGNWKSNSSNTGRMQGVRVALRVLKEKLGCCHVVTSGARKFNWKYNEKLRHRYASIKFPELLCNLEVTFFVLRNSFIYYPFCWFILRILQSGNIRPHSQNHQK